MQSIGQAMGICSVAISVFLYLYTNKRTTLFLKLIADLLWVLHFWLIGCYTAMITTAIAIIRELLLIKNIRSRAIVIVFPVLFFASLIFTYSSVVSIIPPVASTFFTFGLWSVDVNRKEVAVSSSLMLVYGILNNSYATVINEIFTLSSLYIGVLRNRKGGDFYRSKQKRLGMRIAQTKK